MTNPVLEKGGSASELYPRLDIVDDLDHDEFTGGDRSKRETILEKKMPNSWPTRYAKDSSRRPDEAKTRIRQTQQCTGERSE